MNTNSNLEDQIILFLNSRPNFPSFDLFRAFVRDKLKSTVNYFLETRKAYYYFIFVKSKNKTTNIKKWPELYLEYKAAEFQSAFEIYASRITQLSYNIGNIGKEFPAIIEYAELFPRITRQLEREKEEKLRELGQEGLKRRQTQALAALHRLGAPISAMIARLKKQSKASPQETEEGIRELEKLNTLKSEQEETIRVILEEPQEILAPGQLEFPDIHPEYGVIIQSEVANNLAQELLNRYIEQDPNMMNHPELRMHHSLSGIMNISQTVVEINEENEIEYLRHREGRTVTIRLPLNYNFDEQPTHGQLYINALRMGTIMRMIEIVSDLMLDEPDLIENPFDRQGLQERNITIFIARLRHLNIQMNNPNFEIVHPNFSNRYYGTLVSVVYTIDATELTNKPSDYQWYDEHTVIETLTTIQLEEILGIPNEQDIRRFQILSTVNMNNNNRYCMFEPTKKCPCGCGGRWCRKQNFNHDDDSIFCLERAILKFPNIKNNTIFKDIEDPKLIDYELYKFRKKYGYDPSSENYYSMTLGSFPTFKKNAVSNLVKYFCKEFNINIDMIYGNIKVIESLFKDNVPREKVNKIRNRKGDHIIHKPIEDSNTYSIKIASFLGHIWPIMNRTASKRLLAIANGKQGKLKLKRGFIESINKIQNNMFQFQKDVKNIPPQEILNEAQDLDDFQDYKGTIQGNTYSLIKFTKKNKLHQFKEDFLRCLSVMKKKGINKVGTIVVYDFETRPSKKHNIERIYSYSVLIVYNYKNEKIRKEKLVFEYGSHKECITSFIKLMNKISGKTLTEKTVFIAHNGAKFDASILKSELARRMQIRQVNLNGLIRMSVKDDSVVFIDSMRFFPGSLESLAKTYAQEQKLKYPYNAYNSKEFRNSEYTSIPKEIKYEYLKMKKEHYTDLLKGTNKSTQEKLNNKIFSYFHELSIVKKKFSPKKYCKLYNDTDCIVLKQILFYFYDLYKEHLTYDFSPVQKFFEQKCKSDLDIFRNKVQKLFKLQELYPKVAEACLSPQYTDMFEHSTLPAMINAHIERIGCYDNIPNVKGPLKRFIEFAIEGGRVHAVKEHSNVKFPNLIENHLGQEITPELKLKLKEICTVMGITSLDANSLYPSTMAFDPLPSGRITLLKQSDIPQIINNLRNSITLEKHYILCVDIGAKNNHQIPNLSSREEGIRQWNNNLNTNLVMTSSRLESFNKTQGIDFETFKIHCGIMFESKSYKLCEFMKKMYKLRKTLDSIKKRGGDPIKLAMNAAYGRNIMKEQKFEMVMKTFTNSGIDRDIDPNMPLEQDPINELPKNIHIKHKASYLQKMFEYNLKNEGLISGEPVIIHEDRKNKKIIVEYKTRKLGSNFKNRAQVGAFILAGSKNLMDYVLLIMESKNATLTYTDTDCIHCDSKTVNEIKREEIPGLYTEDIVGNDLCQFKDDFDTPLTKGGLQVLFPTIKDKNGKILEEGIPTISVHSIYGGKKMYAHLLLGIRKEGDKEYLDTTEYLKFKGVSSGQLRFHDYEQMYEGRKLKRFTLADELGNSKIQFKKLSSGELRRLDSDMRVICFNKDFTKNKEHDIIVPSQQVLIKEANKVKDNFPKYQNMLTRKLQKRSNTKNKYLHTKNYRDVINIK